MAQLAGTWKLTRYHTVVQDRGKALVFIELTVQWETISEAAYEREKAKYTELLDLFKEKGSHTWLFPVDVGARGFCSQSVCRLMTAVGSTSRDRRMAILKLSQAANETREDELEAINQRTVIDHHCRPTRDQRVHGIVPKHSTTAASMLMMLVEEQSMT